MSKIYIVIETIYNAGWSELETNILMVTKNEVSANLLLMDRVATISHENNFDKEERDEIWKEADILKGTIILDNSGDLILLFLEEREIED